MYRRRSARQGRLPSIEDEIGDLTRTNACTEEKAVRDSKGGRRAIDARCKRSPVRRWDEREGRTWSSRSCVLLRRRRSSSIKRALEAENHPKRGSDGQTLEDTNERPVTGRTSRRRVCGRNGRTAKTVNSETVNSGQRCWRNDRCLASQPIGHNLSRQGFRKRT